MSVYIVVEWKHLPGVKRDSFEDQLEASVCKHAIVAMHL